MSSKNTDLSAAYLLQQSRWIRDSLDPQVAQEGPDALHSDEILTLDELLRNLLDSNISVEDIRYSRMHTAVLEISGRSTRWPKKLIDRSDALQDAWEAEHGPLDRLGTPLYEPGGRLNGVCEAHELGKNSLLAKCSKYSALARRTGNLGFEPGEWWISPPFAVHAGIIDSAINDHGIVSDSKGAYAVVMTGDDEIPGVDATEFQYRSRAGDPGRYRLTAGTPESRHPVRILRHHSLYSLCKPRVGLRYDGMYKVTGWTLRDDPFTKIVDYIIGFKRLPTESDMESVLCRPFADEVEDYAEYKRIQREMRESHKARALKQTNEAGPAPTDGAVDMLEKGHRRPDTPIRSRTSSCTRESLHRTELNALEANFASAALTDFADPRSQRALLSDSIY